jgi:hypothetical protein
VLTARVLGSFVNYIIIAHKYIGLKVDLWIAAYV